MDQAAFTARHRALVAKLEARQENGVTDGLVVDGLEYLAAQDLQEAGLVTLSPLIERCLGTVVLVPQDAGLAAAYGQTR